MIVEIHHDKETYSEVDLTKIGAYAYANHPSTDCLLTSGIVRGEKEILGWRPGDPYPYADFDPRDIEIHAWNSQFERLIWNRIMVPRYDWPMLELEQFVCTAAQARLYGAAPSKLDAAGPFFQRRHQKDRKGHQHMLKMCRPATEKEQLEWMKAHPPFHPKLTPVERQLYEDKAKRCHHTSDNIDRLHDYCDQDVLTEMGIAKILPEWHEDDLAAFWDSERVNDRGMVVDVDFALAATQYADGERDLLNKKISEITGGVVTKNTQYLRVTNWLRQEAPHLEKLMEYYEGNVKKYSTNADTRANILVEYALDPEFLDPDIAEFIEAIDAAGSSTVSKYEAIANRAQPDEAGRPRVQGLYMFAGAAQSARYSSVGIQAHNLKRDVPKTALRLINAFKHEDEKAAQQAVTEWAYDVNAKIADTGLKNTRSPGAVERKVDADGVNHAHGDAANRAGEGRYRQRRATADIVKALGALVRPTITGCPEGDFDLAWCDWSSVEARMLPWLTLDPRADDRLARFRRGEDIYLHTASAILGKTITKEDEFERQAYGKVPELSLGYLGGVGAFQAMAKNYGVHLEEKKILGIVRDWRDANPWAMDFGKALDAAALQAMMHAGTGFSAGRIEYLYNPDALDGIGCLYAYLPSGRAIPYPGAAVSVDRRWKKEQLQITAYKGAWTPKKDAKDWPRVSVWMGLKAENATQAACADLLMLALKRCRRAGLDVCMHTHDEIVIETEDYEYDGPLLEALMVKRPGWPGDDALPLKAEWGAGYRYKVKFKDD